MAIGKLGRGGIAGIFIRWASSLRFPYMFLLMSVLLVLNLLMPDMIPLADEIIMGLLAVMLGSLKKKPEVEKNTEGID